ncbi:hypothetical protein JCM21900_003229 [Sporobolomyces salmonicolor]
MTEPHPHDPEFAEGDYVAALDGLTHDPDEPPKDLDLNTPSPTAVHHPWLKKLVPGIEKLAATYHLGNWVTTRGDNAQKTWESMPIYVRIGMQALYHGREQATILGSTRVEAMLKAQSVKQGIAFDSPTNALAHIQAFVKTYNIDCSELLHPNVADYKTFNQFFSRALRPGARPLASPEDPKVVSSAADCRLTVFETVEAAKEFWIKGQNFTVANLLQDESLANTFENGEIAVFRLAPADYHRYHSPVSAVVGPTKEIAGTYYTVNPCAVNENLDVFTRNKRDVTLLSMPVEGSTPIDLAFVQVGAMLVGSIIHTASQDASVTRGDELGYFAYGGSTVILLCPPGLVKWDADLVANSKARVETAVRVGEQIGRFV